MGERRIARWARKLYRWACQRLYSELAWLYDPVSWLVSAGRWASWRRLALPYVTGPCVLEVGFGTGELLLEMANRPWYVCGLEPSPAMQRIAARKMRRRGLRANRVRGRVQRLPFVGGSFDTIISTFPSEYILDPVALHELARLLRSPAPADAHSGGRLVIVGLQVYRILSPGSAESPGEPPEREPFARFQQAAWAAGLTATIHVHHSPPLGVPVIVAERGP